MAIKKTKNGTYRLRVYVPEEVQSRLGMGSIYEKRFKTRKEAKSAELKLSMEIDKAKGDQYYSNPLQKEDILFSDFYYSIWLESYKAGQTTSTVKPPTQATVFQTENLFRLHILPLLGKYSLDYLNNNKQLMLSLLTPKANSYANFKALRGYINSVFDWAEELEYIPVNKLHKTISRIKAIKKQVLKDNRNEDDLSLDAEELRDWLLAFDEDLENNLLEFKDYVLFYTTFFLSDRKSESYALRWKDINFENSTILIEHSLDMFGNLKPTKGGKKTIFKAPEELMDLLLKWKEEQKKELKLFKLRQPQSQFVFTYNDRKNNINVPLHIDYLNYRMNSVRRRHKHLSKASPHKLRHTGATLARQAGVSLQEISEALTHSDQEVTKVYVNTPNIVNQTAGSIAFKSIKK